MINQPRNPQRNTFGCMPESSCATHYTKVLARGWNRAMGGPAPVSQHRAWHDAVQYVLGKARELGVEPGATGSMP